MKNKDDKRRKKKEIYMRRIARVGRMTCKKRIEKEKSVIRKG